MSGPTRVFVCSPLRGDNGQPSAKNIALARKLMKAVFDEGNAPFVPHLLYPQVLSESPTDLALSFEANYSFLSVCDEMWVWAYDRAGCSKGMEAEINYALERGRTHDHPLVFFMPPAFQRVKKDLETELKASLGSNVTTHVASCRTCREVAGVNHNGDCMKCFSEGRVQA